MFNHTPLCIDNYIHFHPSVRFATQLTTHSLVTLGGTDGSKIYYRHRLCICIFRPFIPTWSSPVVSTFIVELLALLRGAEHTASWFFIICCLLCFSQCPYSFAPSWFTSLCSSNPPIVNSQSVTKKSIQFYWVPSHYSVHGNEQVDVLAGSAMVTSLPSSLPLSASEFFPKFSHLIWRQRQLSWPQANTNKFLTVKPSDTQLWNSFHSIQCWQTALICLQLGYTRLISGYLISKIPPPVCRHFNSQLTFPYSFPDFPYAATWICIFPCFWMNIVLPVFTEHPHEFMQFSISRLMHFLAWLKILADIWRSQDFPATHNFYKYIFLSLI